MSLELRPSRTLVWFLVIAHAGAMGLLPAINLPLWIVAAVAVGIMVSLFRTAPRFAFLSHPESTTSAVWLEGDEWRLFSHGGEEEAAALLPGSFVHPRLVVLLFRLRSSGRRQSVIILPDMVEANGFRRLRVRLALTPPGRPHAS